MGGACSTQGDIRNAYEVLFGRPEGKRPVGRPRRCWEENTEMDLKEIGCEGVNSVYLGSPQNPVAVSDLRIPKKAEHFLTI
jgi:hypothetical protein